MAKRHCRVQWQLRHAGDYACHALPDCSTLFNASRFSFEYVEAALAGRGARIVVMEDGELEDDLVRDVTEGMTTLCARFYGRRSARRSAEPARAAASEA